jgi:predicted short-subunit dehydrogenase-like oxidoreductase (DUF2520 family)
VAIVGAGRVGTALGVLLRRAGHRVVAASGRAGSRRRIERHLPGTDVVGPAAAARAAAVVFVCVPVDAIVVVVCELAGGVGAGTVVIHVSGSASLDTLAAAEARGATVLSLHPLQTFPDVRAGVERLPGSGMAVTARDQAATELGEALARDVGAVPFVLRDDVKPLYHAAAVFCANYLVVVEGIAERVMREAGVDDPLPLLQPLGRTAFDRAFGLGPASALTGPASRGDVGTIERNLRALADGDPEAVDAYVALARAAARLANEAGRLADDDRRRVEEALRTWR